MQAVNVVLISIVKRDKNRGQSTHKRIYGSHRHTYAVVILILLENGILILSVSIPLHIY